MVSLGSDPSGRGGGDAFVRGSEANGDGAVALADGGELVEVEVLVMGVAEQQKDVDVRETLVGEPLVEVVDVAHGGGGVAAGVPAAKVAGPDGELLEERWFASPADVFEDFPDIVLEAEVQVAFDVIEQ